MAWLKLRLFPRTHHYAGLKYSSPLLYLYLHKAIGRAFDDAVYNVLSAKVYSFDQF